MTDPISDLTARGDAGEIPFAVLQTYWNAESAVWRDRPATTQGEAVEVNQAATRAGLTAVAPHLLEAVLKDVRAEYERNMLAVIDERDRAQGAADELAQAISAWAGQDVGEHSNANDPWANARAFTEGLRMHAGELAYDPLKPGGTVYTDHDQAYNPIRHVIHRTYEGRLAWCCGHCLRVSLDPTDGSQWTCCGEQDGDAVVSDPIVCAEGAGECLLAGTDDCICPDQHEETR